MTDPRTTPDDRPNVGTTPLLEEIQGLQGEELPNDQDAFLDPDQIESRRTPTRTELDDGEPMTDPSLIAGDIAPLDGLAMDGLRDGETDDPKAATEEGLTYVPPSDPPFLPGEDDPAGEVTVAAGRGVDALASPYDEDHRNREAVDAGFDLDERIRDALRADAITSVLLDRIEVVTSDGRATVRGSVDTVDDGDTIAAVIERVEGVEEVIDETELAE